MSSILTPGERLTPWGTTGDLARRVARLEAVESGGGDSTKRILVCWAGSTPTVTGNGLVWRVPFDADGSSFTFDLATAFARIESLSGSAVSFRLEKSPGGEVAFTPTTVATVIVAAGDYEQQDVVSDAVDSGDLVRLVFAAVPATSTKFQVELLGSE